MTRSQEQNQIINKINARMAEYNNAYHYGLIPFRYKSWEDMIEESGNAETAFEFEDMLDEEMPYWEGKFQELADEIANLV